MQGNGTQESPYIITTPEDFELVRNNLSAYYELGNDIDFKGAKFIALGESAVGKRCAIKFDGKGYTIKNVLPYPNSSGFYGFFGYSQEILVKNVQFENISLSYNNGDINEITNIGLLASNVIGEFNNVCVKGTLRLSGYIGRWGGLFGIITESAGRSRVQNVYTELHIVLTSIMKPNTTISSLVFGGLAGVIVNDANNPTSISNIVLNNRLSRSSIVYNHNYGRLAGQINTNSFNFTNVYANISNFASSITENIAFVNDTTILNPITLNSDYWIHRQGELPILRTFIPPIKTRIDVSSYTKKFRSNAWRYKSMVYHLISYMNPITSSVTARKESGEIVKENVSSYMGYAYSDRRVEIKQKRTSYILNINSDIRYIRYIKYNRLKSYVKPITASATIVGASKQRLVHLSSHVKPVTSSVTSLGRTVIHVCSYVNSINTNVSLKLDIKRSSNVSEIHSDRHVYAKSNVSSYSTITENSVQTIRKRFVKVVAHVDAFKSTSTITKKIKTISNSSYLPPINSTYHKTQIKYVEKSSYLGSMGARVVKGGYIRFSSHMKRKQVNGKSWRYVKTKRFPISYSASLTSKANMVAKLQKNVSSHLGIVNGNTRIKPNFFLPKMIRVRGRIRLNRSSLLIKTNKSITRFTGNINSSHSDDWGDG